MKGAEPELMNSNEAVKILVVEDSPTQAERLKFLLEEQGYKITLTPDGRQALACLEDYRPELIISDIVMPQMSGYELCKQIKTNQHTREIPMILMTGLSDAEDVLKAVDCGADSFITKPYSEEYLFAQIRRFLTDRSLRRTTEEESKSVKIQLPNDKHIITVDPQRMLSLLLSTYEAAIYRNNELNNTLEEMNELNNQLEDLYKERMEKLSAEAVERQRVEMLQSNAERLRKLIEADFNSNLIVDRKGIIRYLNSNTEILFQKSKEDLIDEVFEYPILEQNAELEIVTINGDRSLVEMRFMELEWDEQTAYFVSLHDITERKQAEILLRQQTEALEKEIAEREHLQAELHALSVNDELTGLYNRRGFIMLAEQQWLQAKRRNEEFVLLYADVDNLKTINDTLGHVRGDEALKEISSIIKRTFRASDILARIGGDEFTVLLVNCHLEFARELVDRLK